MDFVKIGCTFCFVNGSEEGVDRTWWFCTRRGGGRAAGGSFSPFPEIDIDLDWFDIFIDWYYYWGILILLSLIYIDIDFVWFWGSILPPPDIASILLLLLSSCRDSGSPNSVSSTWQNPIKFFSGSKKVFRQPDKIPFQLILILVFVILRHICRWISDDTWYLASSGPHPISVIFARLWPSVALVKESASTSLVFCRQFWCRASWHLQTVALLLSALGGKHAFSFTSRRNNELLCCIKEPDFSGCISCFLLNWCPVCS